MTTDDKNAGQAADATLEARLARIEAILAQLETGEVELEEALRLFEEGVGHVRAAEETLTQTELKVEELLAKGDTAALEGEHGE